MKRISIGKKLGGAVALATALVMGMAPMTAFAQENLDAEEPKVEVSTVENGNSENSTVENGVSENSVEVNGVTGKVTEDTELPYYYTVNEDGSIAFYFNGQEYTYGAEEDPTGTVVTKGARLNVRTGAGMDYEVIDQLCPGEEVSVIGTEGDWYQITVPAKTGYVHGDYLEVLENATNETDEALLKMFMMMFMDGIDDATNRNYALTPDGNLTLVDDYGSTNKSGKQFITVVTKSGNYFYIIIDRDDEGNETVHFLNMVDEADLLSLMDEEEAQKYMDTITEPETTEPEVTLEPETTTEPTEEPGTEEPSDTDTGSNKTGALMLVVLVAVGGAGGFFFLKKSKKKETQSMGPDPDFDYNEEEEDYLAGLDDEEEDSESDEDDVDEE